jgi:hypothetical protein
MPTLAGFLVFVRNIMGITAAQIPDSSPTIDFAFNIAMELVNSAINTASTLLYQTAVYNLAGHNLLEFAQDPIPVVPYPPNSDSTVGFFTYTRKQFDMLGFVSGVISASSDEGTSQSLVVMDAAKEFTIMNLQQLKSPYGRAYLGIAQSYGPNVWGLT